MVTETRELTVFHRVIRHGSYAKAAEELALTPSGVSRLVSRLEARLGARLVHRTTRKLSLTEAGRHSTRARRRCWSSWPRPRSRT